MPDNTTHQILTIYRGRLNAGNGDTGIGGPLRQPLGSSPVAGQLGAKVTLSHEDAAHMSDPGVGTLYGGVYQYVYVYPTPFHAVVRGRVAFYWSAAARVAFRVTPDHPPGTGCIAGIFINAITPGRCWFIQTKGLATILYTGMITKTSPAAQDLVICRNNDNVGEVLADATPLTSVEVRSILGVASEAPVGGALRLVELRPGFDNF